VERLFRCKECDAVIPVEDVQRTVMEIESTKAIVRTAGKVIKISGFASVDAFIYVYWFSVKMRKRRIAGSGIPPWRAGI
jgi:hypothetical protein